MFISASSQFKYYSKQHSSKTFALSGAIIGMFKYYSKQHSSKTIYEDKILAKKFKYYSKQHSSKTPDLGFKILLLTFSLVSVLNSAYLLFIVLSIL